MGLQGGVQSRSRAGNPGLVARMVGLCRPLCARRSAVHDCVAIDAGGLGLDVRGVALWTQCWPVIRNPAPSIAVAMPLVCVVGQSWALDKPQPRQLSGAYTVRWLGWGPKVGIQVADSRWQPGGPPPVPQAGSWTDLDRADTLLGFGLPPGPEDNKTTPAVLNPFKLAPAASQWRVMDGLYLRQAPRLHGLDKDGFTALQGLNYAAFLGCLPPGIRDAMDLVHAGKGSWQPYDSTIVDPGDDMEVIMIIMGSTGWSKVGSFCKTLAMLAGANPAPGVDVATAGLHRRQFVHHHRVFAGMATPRSMAGKEFRAGIDLGQSSTALLARHLGSNARVIRVLAALPEPCLEGALSFLQTPACMPLLEGMPDNTLQALSCLDSNGWLALEKISRNTRLHGPDFVLWSQELGGYCNACFDEFASTERGLDARYLGQGIRPIQGSLAWLGGVLDKWNHVDDMASNFLTELVLPALVGDGYHFDTDPSVFSRQGITYVRPSLDHGLDDKRTSRALMLSLGVPRLSRCLDVHLQGSVHDARLRLGALPDESPGLDWGLACPDVVMPGGPTLRCLGSQVELDSEGVAMQNCVGGYGQACAQRTTVILSLGAWRGVRTREWKPTSTAELVRGRDGGVQVRQHRGTRNSRPAQADIDALAWWMDSVLRGDIELVEGALVEPALVDHSPPARLARELGEDWRTSAAHAHRWDRWRRLLDTRAHSFADWLATMPGEAQAFVPGYETLLAHARTFDTQMAKYEVGGEGRTP